MPQDVLARLSQDHREIERLLRVIESVSAASTALDSDKMADLEAIRWYLAAAGSRHHIVEDRIFGIILKHIPRFAAEIYDLRDDHDQSTAEFSAFSRAIDGLKAGVSGGYETFRDCAQSYVANERGHFISEEELFFPYARRCLTPEQWAALAAAMPDAAPSDPSTKAWADRIGEILKRAV